MPTPPSTRGSRPCTRAISSQTIGKYVDDKEVARLARYVTIN
jgi:hypothetical protein